MSGAENQLSLSRGDLVNRRGAQRKSFLAFLFLFLFCKAALAPVFLPLGTPQDNLEVRRAVAKREELKGPFAEYYDLIQARFMPLKLANVERIFGPQVGTPGDMILPIYVPSGIALSGLRPSNTPDRSHVGLYALGDIGCVEVFYGFDGERVAGVVFHHRAGRAVGPMKRGFVPLQSVADFEERLKWDLEQFQDIKKWLDDHLAKVTELGVIELSDHTPARVHLEDGEDYLVTAAVESFSTFSVSVRVDCPNSRDWNGSGVRRQINRPNQSVVFPAAGKLYRLTPRLQTEPRAVDLGVVEIDDHVPTRLAVGADRQCIVTATKGSGTGITIRLEIHSQKYSMEIQQPWAPDSNEEVRFPLDGIIFSFTPTFTFSFTPTLKPPSP